MFEFVNVVVVIVWKGCLFWGCCLDVCCFIAVYSGFLFGVINFWVSLVYCENVLVKVECRDRCHLVICDSHCSYD